MEIKKIIINNEIKNLKIYFFVSLICAIIFLNSKIQIKQIENIMSKIESNFQLNRHINKDETNKSYNILLSKKIKEAYEKNGFVNIN